jgi:hypothetical protein
VPVAPGEKLADRPVVVRIPVIVNTQSTRS